MKNIQTEIKINAPKETVWQILIDFGGYPGWNPFIRKIKGKAVKGERLENHMYLPGQKPMVFKPRILELEEQKIFRWLGKLFFNGLFDGEHYFEIQEVDSNQVKLIHGENFSGLLVGLLMKKIEDNTLQGFQAMNQALKNRAEKVYQETALGGSPKDLA